VIEYHEIPRLQILTSYRRKWNQQVFERASIVEPRFSGLVEDDKIEIQDIVLEEHSKGGTEFTKKIELVLRVELKESNAATRISGSVPLALRFVLREQFGITPEVS